MFHRSALGGGGGGEANEAPHEQETDEGEANRVAHDSQERPGGAKLEKIRTAPERGAGVS